VSVMALHRGSDPRESTTRSSNPLITEANPALGQRLTPPKTRLEQDPVPVDVTYQPSHDELLVESGHRQPVAQSDARWR